MSLRLRILAVVLIALVPAIFLMVYSALDQRHQVRHSLRQHVDSMVQFAAREERAMLDSAERFLDAAHVALSGATTLPQLERILFELVETRDGFFIDVALSDASGTLMLWAGNKLPAFKFDEMAWFADVRDATGLVMSQHRKLSKDQREDIQELDDNERHIVFAAKRYPEISHAQPGGVLVAALDLEWLNRKELSVWLDLPDGAALTKVDKDGTVLIRQPAGERALGQQLHNEQLLAAIRSDSNRSGIVETDSTLYFYKPLEPVIHQDPITLIVSIPSASVYKGIQQTVLSEAALIILCTILVLCLAYVGTENYVLQAIDGVRGRMRAIIEGESCTGQDTDCLAESAHMPAEFTPLLTHFDEMATALDERHRSWQQANNELRTMRDRLQHLSRKQSQEIEAERKSLAREIHDELGQLLTHMNITLTWLTRACGEKAGLEEGTITPSPKEVSERIRQAQESLRHALGTVQRITTDLRPPVLDDRGLGPAIGWLAERLFGNTDTALELDIHEIERLDSEDSIALFRVAQETLTNAMRHAEATTVRIELDADDTQVLLRIADDGRGFDLQQARQQNGMGILGMHERMAGRGGELHIETDRDKGTTVQATLPMNQTSDTHEEGSA